MAHNLLLWFPACKGLMGRIGHLCRLRLGLHSLLSWLTMTPMEHGPHKEHWTTLTIRHISATQKEQLRVRAARHGRSMESELRHILAEALAQDAVAEMTLAERIRRRFEPLGGLDLPERAPSVGRESPTFDSCTT